MEQYEEDLADFQAATIEKSTNWVQVKYPKTEVEFKFQPQLTPPSMPLDYAAYDDEITTPDSKDAEGDYILTKNYGYGAPTTGYLLALEGEKKSFGVYGEGTSSNLGYMHPPETSSACVEKFVSIVVFPKHKDFQQTDAEDELTITVSSESPQEMDFT